MFAVLQVLLSELLMQFFSGGILQELRFLLASTSIFSSINTTVLVWLFFYIDIALCVVLLSIVNVLVESRDAMVLTSCLLKGRCFDQVLLYRVNRCGLVSGELFV